MSNLSTDDVIKCLNTYSFDDGKDNFLEIMGTIINLEPLKICQINKCFSFGSKKLGLLFTKKPDKSITCNTEIKNMNIFDFLISLKGMDDNNKYIHWY